MKKQFTLQIAKPCSENWNGFEQTSSGGFCTSCTKTVIDFTTMSDEQIAAHFSNQSGKTCGRFRPAQLKTYSLHQPPTIRPGLRLLQASLLSLLVLLVSKPLAASATLGEVKTELSADSSTMQILVTDKVDTILKGIIKSEEDDAVLPGVNVLLKGSQIGTVSDAEGKFEFPKKLNPGDVIQFSFIGMDTQEYVIPSEAPAVVEIKMAMTYCVLLGEVGVNEVYQPSGIRGFWQKVKRIF